jgi:glycosyltransferase involved in cell wall biosynthesis
MKTSEPTPRELLLITPWMAMGGADKLHLDLVTQLARRGWRITLATTLPHSHPWRALFAPHCAAIIELGDQDPAAQPDLLVRAARDLRPGWALISNAGLAYHALPALRAALPDAAILDLGHAIDPDDLRGGYPALSLDHTASIDLHVTVSAALRQWMLERGADAQRVHTCHAGVDTALWDPGRYDQAALRRALALPESGVVGVFPARLERVKRPYLALRLMEWLVQRTPDAHFLIAGDGTQAPLVRGFVRARRLAGRIRVLGPVDSERMRELLAISDLLLLPSAMEGLSIAIYEAMAMGAVPLSVAAGGQAELVTPECGVLVPRSPREEQDYRDALAALADDRAQLRAMGRAARQRIIGQFGLDQMGERWEQLLHRAAQLHTQLPRPGPSTDAVARALQAAATIAARDAGWYRPAPSPAQHTSLRSRARAIYWRLVDDGLWWIVPLLEQIRRQKN